MSALDDLLKTIPTQSTATATMDTPKTSALDALLSGIGKTSQPNQPTVKTISPYLGGGAYNSTPGQPNQVINTGHDTYGGVAPQAGMQRDDTVPVGLGGANSNPANIKPIDLNQAKALDKLETQLAIDVKNGKISLPEARLKILTEKQKADNPPQGVLANLFGSTVQAVKDIVKNPFNLSPVKQLPAKIVKDTVGAVYNTNLDEIQRVKDLFDMSKSRTTSQIASQGLKATTGALNVLFSPISALFTAAGDIPVLGTLAKTAMLPFAVGGDVGKEVFKQGLNALPLSKEVKTNLNDVVEEIGTLTGQILIGGYLYGKGEKFLADKRIELTKKFGEQGADTIIQKSVEKAQATEQTQPKIEPTQPTSALDTLLKTTQPQNAQPLAQEATKLTPIYHGTPEKFSKFDTNKSEGGASWFTADKNEITSGKAGAVQGAGQKLNIMERYIKPDVKLATPEMADKYLTDQLIQQGYRGVKYPAETAKGYESAEWTKLWFPNEDTITKSQLLNQSKAVGEVKPTEPPTEPTAISGVAKQIEAKAVEKGLIDKGYTDLAGYDASTIKLQSELAAKYTPEQINRFATGEEVRPPEMKPGTALSIAEDYAMEHNDSALFNKLMESPLATEISQAASTVSLSKMREPDSATAQLREAKKTLETQIKNHPKQKGDIIQKTSGEAKNNTLTKEELNWSKFLSEIQC